MSKRKNRFTEDDIEDINEWTKERDQVALSIALTSSINIKCKSKAQRDVIKSIDDNDISIITGPPGTGKTYLSCAKALKFIKEEHTKYKKIILIKSVNVPRDEEIGYLKGDLNEKMEGFVYPFMSNFEKIIGKAALHSLKMGGTIEILPIKFALGTTLDNSIIIIDEAQQISKDNLRTLLTRIGEDSKMIYLGDIKQKSVNKGQKSALEILIEYFAKVDGIGVVELSKKDIVRHPIIEKIEEIFESIEVSERLNGINR